ncbi:phage holin family protein [Larkinella arboricola]|uniref:Putative membrane protein n=1 Tax=Larkinella arboricola TaxID=643671 RepID=A0A327XA11_LARAB|nr:phage holin family protein [Larkinella arboricola]RAK03098.1 putative membrane protein [Larkinella arboricola]
MNLILHLLLDAAVIFGLAYLMPQVDVKSFGTALLIAVILAVLNFLVGWLIRFPLNLVTFFLLTGIVRIVVTAILLKLIDKMMGSFTIAGFWPALVIAIAVAVVGGLVDGALAPSEEVIEHRQQEVMLLSPAVELASRR